MLNEPKIRRRRGGETIAAIRRVAKKLLRPIAHLPISRAGNFAEHTLVWLHLWEWNENQENNEIFEAHSESEQDHLFPHL